MQSSIRKVTLGAALLALTCLTAVVGYVICGWGVLEAIYMVTLTIFGVGFREVRPIEDPQLQIFTIGVIVAGCTSAIYAMGGFIQMIAEGELNRFLGARKMTRGIENLQGHVIVCGNGRVGQILAKELVNVGREFVLVDTNQERLQEAETAGMLVLVGDATEESVLRAAGVEKAAVVATVLPDDAANVFITLTARDLSPDVEVIARAQSPATERKLLRSGAGRVVLPAAIGATRIARLITRPSAESLIAESALQESLAEDLEQIGLRLVEVDLTVGSDCTGRPLKDVSLGENLHFVIVAVRRSDGTVIKAPERDCILREGDVLVILAHADTVISLKRRESRGEIVYRGVRSGS